MTITLYPYKQLGHANHGWLDTRHHFSFANYRNLDRMQFGVLCVINDDSIAPGEGFGMHPHQDMEIITYVRQGAITHQDSMGNLGRTTRGDVQVMSAGTGVHHSEYNKEKEKTTLYQLWIYPDKKSVKPAWATARFPNEHVTDSVPLLVSGREEDAGKGALFIHQDAAIYGGRMRAGTSIVHPVKYQAYILVSQGVIDVSGTLMHQGDGAEVTHADNIILTAIEDSELLVIDVPPVG